MAANYWIKLYHEILHDPKMGMMTDNLWRRTIELFLIAGETNKEGDLPDIQEMAWTLRVDTKTLENDLKQLENIGILVQKDTIWCVSKFAERQAAVSDAERMRQYRKRQKDQKESKPRGRPKKALRNVTPDTDTDTDILKSKDLADKPPGPKTIVKDAFLEITNLKWPYKKSDQNFWWSEFADILHISNKDPSKAIEFIKTSFEYMTNHNLSVHGPQSVKGFCRQLASGQTLNGASHATPKNSTHKARNRSGTAPTFATGLGTATADELRQAGLNDTEIREYLAAQSP